jgi:DNA repair photolyase
LPTLFRRLGLTLISKSYRYALGLTSQFYYCGLPLRLDAYSKCQFSCKYCFARARGGNATAPALQFADISALERRLERVSNGVVTSAVDEFLARKQPIHFGGMSDPFIPLELEAKVSLGILDVLAKYKYPTIISTKGNIISRDSYVSILSRGNFVVQLSICSLDDALLRKIDVGTPGPTALMAQAELLAQSGIPVACRIQPVLPSREQDAFSVISKCAKVGIRHVAVEHLKLPVESGWKGTGDLSRVLETDVRLLYSDGKRDGREWILPIAERLTRMMSFRRHAHALGLSFGAADNDLLHLSDGNCCCSGADLLMPGLQHFQYNFLTAVREGMGKGVISFSTIANQWKPARSIAMYVNSRSRLPKTMDNSNSDLDRYVRYHWNNTSASLSPKSLFGVESTGQVDGDGNLLYAASPLLKTLTAAT